jgi:pyruvate/2-oxoglutarate/acetoin dehydrogenase E1 component
MKYIEEIRKAMTFLANHPKTIFIGQSVAYEGTGMYDTLSHVPKSKKIEMPIAEYLQSGIVNGMALNGMIPVSVFPRWNFLLMGTDQIVNHLDKFQSMSNTFCNSKVIIRVAVGGEKIVDPQCQHKGNFTDAFRSMTKNINIVELINPENILYEYKKALERTDNISTILVEFADFNHEK